ncbi:hypothetical protein T439DRAFT_345684 [Meredithblackwellia eburnea MCA 4105]
MTFVPAPTPLPAGAAPPAANSSLDQYSTDYSDIAAYMKQLDYDDNNSNNSNSRDRDLPPVPGSATGPNSDPQPSAPSPAPEDNLHPQDDYHHNPPSDRSNGHDNNNDHHHHQAPTGLVDPSTSPPPPRTSASASPDPSVHPVPPTTVQRQQQQSQQSQQPLQRKKARGWLGAAPPRDDDPPPPTTSGAGASDQRNTEVLLAEIQSLRAELAKANDHVRSTTAFQEELGRQLDDSKKHNLDLQARIADSINYGQSDDGGDTNAVIKGADQLEEAVDSLVFEMIDELADGHVPFSVELESRIKANRDLDDFREVKEYARLCRKDKLTVGEFLSGAITTSIYRLFENEIFIPFHPVIPKDHEVLLNGIYTNLQRTYPHGYTARWRSLTYATVNPGEAADQEFAAGVAEKIILNANVLCATLLPDASPPIDFSSWSTKTTKRVREAMGWRLMTQTKFLSSEFRLVSGKAETKSGYSIAGYTTLGLTKTVWTKGEQGRMDPVVTVLKEPGVNWSKKAKPAK